MPEGRAAGAPEYRRTGVADLGSVRLERIGSTAHVTMCGADRLNTEDNDQVDSMETAVDLADSTGRRNTSITKVCDGTREEADT